eukprot:NODE_755_length_4533_cov_0.124041.p1 type:complete len:223 gc:universal NODE_755_length_4533_cov_0.124041:2198-2866(+)
MSNLISQFHSVNNIVKKYSSTLIAVSKYKPIDDIKAIYEGTGHLHYGENYIQELEEKTKILPRDIHWHFIGHLQSNKCKTISALVTKGHFITLHTLDSIKLARKLNNLLDGYSLDVLIQVNTSKEISKSGLPLSDCKELISHIINDFKNLKLVGLMCIGAPNQKSPNPDFLEMNELLQKIQTEFKIQLKLSMGMSNDFEEALDMGSNYVRVGSKIFGERSKQ